MDTETLVITLLGGLNPSRARDFMLAWSELRSSALADAHRIASERAASGAHLPQARGQLRYHLGEAALGAAAKASKIGAVPMPTLAPGGSFMLAQVGRFALVSVTVKDHGLLPRKSITRKYYSQRNQEIDPQRTLFDEDENPRRAIELAFFGCLLTVPSRNDPSVAAELALGVTNAAMTDWIEWITLHRVNALLLDRVGAKPGKEPPQPVILPDNVFPTWRVPKIDKNDKDDAGG